LELCAHRADGDLCDRGSLPSSHVALLRSTFHVIHPLLPPGQWLRVAVGQLHFVDSWQQYPYKTDSRHVYALTSLPQETSGLPKHRASSCQRGKDMLHFGKDTLKVTSPEGANPMAAKAQVGRNASLREGLVCSARPPNRLGKFPAGLSLPLGPRAVVFDGLSRQRVLP
jgi:hypothetical protein